MWKRLLLVLLLVPLWIFLRWVYRDRLGAFGCFDDCFNIMAGYFITTGKHLYSEIFFNHQPIPAYVSALIQLIYHPTSIYELIYRHRMVLIGFFAISDAILVLRFGFPAFAFALLFETTKGFLFGERFLAESMIVYPLVYVFGIFWQKTVYRFEPIVVALATWFIVFSREPYVLLALFLFGMLMWQRKSSVAIILFLFLSIITIASHDLSAYWWNVVTVNAQAVKEGLSWSTFFYPVAIFFGGQWNLFRWIEVVLSLLLLVALLRAGYKRAALVLTVLALSNIRPVEPGTIYYVAFHHLVYYALLIASLAYIGKRSYLVIAPVILLAVLSPQSYLHEKVDRAGQFGIGYGHYIMQGEIIKRLARSTNTVFLEQWDDLIYWQANLPSAYTYSWYTSSMNAFPVYRSARDAMFQTNPPDFYYGQCGRVEPGKKPDMTATSLPPFLWDKYIRLTQGGTPTCLFVKKDLAAQISDERWISVRDFSVDDPRPSLGKGLRLE